jgi:octaprenyl-diphosphate synthase
MTEIASVYSTISDELAEVKSRTDDALSRAAKLIGCGNVLGADSSGKQLRPAMVILVSRLFGGARETAVRLAAAVELIHAASLIHDDVIDAAPVRRGRPTTLARLGTSDAVLSGDVIFAGVFADLADAGAASALREISHAAAEVCSGEVRENRAKRNFALTREEYLEIVELKTASLYRASAVMGALSAGAPADAVRNVGQFGRSVGMAFQVVDDLLDVVGDEGATGKPVRRDLVEGKVTLPTIIYLAGLDDDRRRETVARFLEGDDAFIARSLDEMAAPKAVAAVREVAQGYSRRALKLLDKLPVGIERVGLAALCRIAADRDA